MLLKQGPGGWGGGRRLRRRRGRVRVLYDDVNSHHRAAPRHESGPSLTSTLLFQKIITKAIPLHVCETRTLSVHAHTHTLHMIYWRFSSTCLNAVLYLLDNKWLTFHAEFNFFAINLFYLHNFWFGWFDRGLRGLTPGFITTLPSLFRSCKEMQRWGWIKMLQRNLAASRAWEHSLLSVLPLRNLCTVTLRFDEIWFW